MLEIRHKDLAARIAEFDTPHGRLETPLLLPVINPIKQAIPARL